jgi:hypothetical protein
MAKTTGSGKVGSGIPGFGGSKGTASRSFRTLVGEFKVEIGKVSVADGKKPGTVNVRIPTTILGGPEQDDGWDPEGKENSWFINVDPSLVNDNGVAFTVDQLKSVFVAAGVKCVGDEPPYAKLEGKQCAVQAWASKPDEKGQVYQRFSFVSLAASKTFADEE